MANEKLLKLKEDLSGEKKQMEELQNFTKIFEEIEVKTELKSLEEEDPNLGQYFKVFYWIMTNYFKAYNSQKNQSTSNSNSSIQEIVIAIDDVIAFIFSIIKENSIKNHTTFNKIIQKLSNEEEINEQILLATVNIINFQKEQIKNPKNL